jgi:hypothetical protein
VIFWRQANFLIGFRPFWIRLANFWM